MKKLIYILSVIVIMSVVTAAPVAAVSPFFSVQGGDVLAGASFAAPSATSGIIGCNGGAAHNTSATVTSWNNRAPAYSGAGGSYGVQAWSFIQDFAAGQGKAGAPSRLAFSNQNIGGSINTADGLSGGMFGSAPCVSYWENNGGTVFDSANIPSLTSGRYHHDGPLTIPATTINNGQQLTLYVDGDVTITGPIRYELTGWTKRQDIPSLKLVVQGSIFIDNAVQELNGTYVAVPESDYVTKKNEFSAVNDGTISTCRKGTGSYNPKDYPTDKIETSCGNPLTVYGSLVANQIWLLRSRGDLTTNVPAETIIYTPETWVAAGPVQSSDSSALDDYQSIIGLPPIF